MAAVMRVLEEALAEAGRLMCEGFQGADRDYTRKGTVDLVTATDLACEAAIRRVIAGAFPGHAVYGEEGGGLVDPAGYSWIVDPLDGTTNFAHRFPIATVSIACLHGGRVVAGGVAAPLLGRTWLAEEGSGSRCNGQPIRVSTVERLEDALLVTGFSYERAAEVDVILKFLSRVLPAVQGVRRTGSAAYDLCQVAEGVFDLYFEHGIHAWDIAAGALLVSEAGGCVSGMAGETLDLFGRRIVAGNERLHRIALERFLPEGGWS